MSINASTKERDYFDYIRADIWDSGIPINWTQSHNDVDEQKNAWACSHADEEMNLWRGIFLKVASELLAIRKNKKKIYANLVKEKFKKKEAI